ncbi:hypothetical protein FEE96_13920 [Parasedimentitalea maritima]|uniref:Uncharacterized protein n=1 Tax=Parasedimentitalea maritima TaxID=2578117 RepID=A0ABY2UT15_9RHOB|nr:hypothetical protein [Zongyanglinia marina]TLP61341.1 hypothetical protein FEE96_13920 [Zongyanglinia marina]
MPTNVPTQNNHRVALFFPEQSRDDFDRLEELTANGLRAARSALEGLQDLSIQNDRGLFADLVKLRTVLERRRLLSDQFRNTAASLLLRLEHIELSDNDTAGLDQIIRDLNDAHNLSHRVCDLLSAEQDVGWHRGIRR